MMRRVSWNSFSPSQWEFTYLKSFILTQERLSLTQKDVNLPIYQITIDSNSIVFSYFNKNENKEIYLAQALHHAIVLAYPHGVHDRQRRLLRGAAVAADEAVSRSRLALRMRRRLRQQVPAAIRVRRDVHAAVVAAQDVTDARVLAVDHRRVQETGVLVHLLARTQMLLARQRPHRREAHTRARGNVHGGVEVIARRHGERIALGMDGARRVARPAAGNRLLEAFMDGRHRQVVVQELRELHHHQRVAIVQIRYVGMDHGGDHSGIRQRLPGDGGAPRFGDAVLVSGRQQPGEGCQRLAQAGITQIVAVARQGTIGRGRVATGIVHGTLDLFMVRRLVMVIQEAGDVDVLQQIGELVVGEAQNVLRVLEDLALPASQAVHAV